MLKQYVVNTFTNTLFSGNPAAVCVVDRFPEDELMRKIARENALSHTAFVLPLSADRYEMRWFTPKMEIDLCGHATLATAYVVTRFLAPEVPQVEFLTKSGSLLVKKEGNLLAMDFPAYQLKPLEVTDELTDALGARPAELWRARDLLCIFEDADTVRSLTPDQEKLKKLKGALMQVTAPGDQGFDCVSRTFAPKMDLPEDPVCGSGHCHIIPYWATKTGKTDFTAYQASPRGGTLYCRLEGDRVILAGESRLYSVSELFPEETL